MASSSSSIAFRILEKSCALSEKYGIDNFLLRRGGAPSVQKIIEDLDEGTGRSLVQYIQDLRAGARTRYRNGRLTITFSTTIHGEVGCHFESLFLDYNRAVGGTRRHPLRSQGTADVTGNNLLAQPDARVIADPINRFSKSPNLVVEVHFRSNETLLQINESVTTYITATDGVFISIGVVIYDRLADGKFAAILLVYHRQLGTSNAVHMHTVSFGTGALSADSLTAWNSLSTNAVRGTGVFYEPIGLVDNPCNAAHADDAIYNIQFPATHLLSISADGLNLTLPAPLLNDGVFTLSLFELQQAIVDAMDAYY